MDLNDKYTYKKNKKEIKRIIYIRGLGKKKDKEIVQKVVFVQTLKIDKESNKIVEQSGWTLGDESNGMFPEYIPEAHEKKVTKVKKVPAKVITADDVDETVIVKYRSAKKQSTANRLKEKIDRLTSSSFAQSENNSNVNSTSILETQSETAMQSESQSKSESTANTKSESQSEFESSSTTQSESGSNVNSTSVLETQSETAMQSESQSKSELTVNTKSESQLKLVAHSESSSEKQSQSNSYNESESTYDTTISKNESELSSSAKRAMFRRGLKETFANLKVDENRKPKEETNVEHRQSFSFLTNDYQPSQNTSFFKNNNEPKASSLSTSKSQSSSLSTSSVSEETKASLLSTSESQSSSLSTSSISEETNVVSDSNISFESESNISPSLNTSKSSALTSVENSAVSNDLKEETPTPTAETEDKLDIITANEETYIKNVPSKTQQDQVVVLSNSEKFKEYQKKIFEQEKSKKDFTPRQKVPINFSILTSFLAQNNEILNNSNVYQIGQAFLLSKKWKVELWTN